MSPLLIYTAIEFNPAADDDVRSTITQPLLADDLSTGDIEESRQMKPAKSHGRFLVFGVLVGFLVQIISLGAYAFMISQYEEEPTNTEGDWFLYSVLSVLTQVDLVIYVMIWIAFTCTMTSHGMTFIRDQSQSPLQRRSVFVVGVYFLVGIVLGAFFAWTMIDFYLGFPIAFVPIAITVGLDLVLCYLMIFCYDLGRTNQEEDDEEEPSKC